MGQSLELLRTIEQILCFVLIISPPRCIISTFSLLGGEDFYRAYSVDVLHLIKLRGWRAGGHSWLRDSLTGTNQSRPFGPQSFLPLRSSSIYFPVRTLSISPNSFFTRNKGVVPSIRFLGRGYFKVIYSTFRKRSLCIYRPFHV